MKNRRLVYISDYTIEEQQSMIMNRIGRGRKTGFKNVFSGCKNRIHAIVTFLALLELINMQRVLITVGEGVNNFWLEETEPVHVSDEEE